MEILYCIGVILAVLLFVQNCKLKSRIKHLERLRRPRISTLEGKLTPTKDLPIEEVARLLKEQLLDSKEIYIFLGYGVTAKDLYEITDAIDQVYKAYNGQEVRLYSQEPIIAKPYDNPEQ